MGKRGPKLKKGVIRTASGQISRGKSTMEILNKMNADREKEVQKFVTDQPHRQGDASRMAECPLGRFCKRYGLDDAIYQGALNYNEIRRRWRAAKGAPTLLRLHSPGTLGDGPSASTVEAWAKRLAAVLHAVVDEVGGEAWLSAELLIVDELEIPERYHEGARRALEALAVEMGTMKKVKRAYA